MYVIITGAGAIGTRFASAQINAGNEVTIIDVSETRIQKAQAALGNITVVGDATRSETLINAGIARADAVIALTGDDGINLAVCQLAKQAFKVRTVAAIANYSHNADIFLRAGADEIVNRTDITLANLTGTLLQHPMAELMNINSRYDKLVTMRIPTDAPSVGKQIGELALPYGLIIAIVISENGEPSVPTEATVLIGGEEVISSCPQEALDELAYALTGKGWITVAT